MYTFKTKPYQHQKQVFNETKQKKVIALFMEMGTGKSKVALDTAGFLFKNKDIDSLLIIAPKGVYDNWSKIEIERHLNVFYNICTWQSNLSKKFMAELESIIVDEKREKNKLHIFVMNIEALSTNKGFAYARAFLKRNPKNMVIVDESTMIKNRKAIRSKNVIKLGRLADYKRILTGSPITKSPLDLFSQCDFLEEKLLGFSSFYAFQSRYAIIIQKNMGHRSFRDIAGYQNLEELNSKLDKFCYRVLKKDCLDLPPKIYLKREVSLTNEQLKAYTEMKKFALTQLENGELSTTQSILTQILRLQQILSGFIKTDDATIQELASNRIQSLIEILDETTGKVIIWATFIFDIKKIEKMLSEKYGKDSVATFFGETPQENRQEIVNRFQNPKSPLKYFVGQSRTGGYGITLTEANTVIYYSNSYDLEVRLQSEDRAHRIGQKNKVTYVDLISPKTIDEKILKALKNKINLAQKTLGEETRDWFV